MRWCICAALCLASLSHGLELSETEKALLDERRFWLIVNENSPGLTAFFETEKAQLIDERTALQQERSALRQEKSDFQIEKDGLRQERNVLDLLHSQVNSERKQIAEDSKSIDVREKRVARVEAALKVAPWVAVGVFAAGVVVGVVSSK
jgi:ElaB/YqjD/DUF883 family membrane-anchored ribosome-binding protein